MPLAYRRTRFHRRLKEQLLPIGRQPLRPEAYKCCPYAIPHSLLMS